jgi:hypothetical protein
MILGPEKPAHLEVLEVQAVLQPTLTQHTHRLVVEVKLAIQLLQELLRELILAQVELVEQVEQVVELLL